MSLNEFFFIFAVFLFPSAFFTRIKKSMNLYSAVVLETVVEVTVREMEQAKVPTENRDPEMIREMTDMAAKHGATKAHDIWRERHK